jgi:glucokinase
VSTQCANGNQSQQERINGNRGMDDKLSFDKFRLANGAKPVACVDIGGTKVAATLVDASGIRCRSVETTVKTGEQDALAQQIVRMLEESCMTSGMVLSDLSALGVSSCGPFVMAEGCIELAAPNICGGSAGGKRGLPNSWPTAVLEAPLRRIFSRVRVENDGISALEAERRWGALQVDGKPMNHCAYVTWSTGIGVGVCVDGHVLRGKNGNAGHAGHTFVSDHDDPLCGCGNVGDVEALIGGNAIPRRFSHLGLADSAALFQACYAGNPDAIKILDELCRVMGRMLYNIIVTLDLQRISIGGSVFWHHREFLLPKLKTAIQGKLPALTASCELVPAGLGERVGDWGAFALVA